MDPKYPGCNCNKCSLQDRPFVPPHFRGSKVTILGEAPGRKEVINQIPFVGNSGQILRQTLDHVGVDVNFTNCCLCQPMGNKTPSMSDVRACLSGRAKRELGSSNLVVGVGNVPLEALTGESGITTKRGVVRWSDELNTRMLFTYHPAFLLRVAEAFPDFVNDMKRIPDLLKYPMEKNYEPYPMGDYRVITDPDEGIAVLAVEFFGPNAPYPRERITLDLETTSLDYMNAEILCGALTLHDITYVFGDYCWRNEQWKEMFQRCLNVTARWTYQNASYDIKVLWANGLQAVCDDDTMLMHYSMDERKGTHGLEFLEKQFLGVDKYKDDFEVAWQRAKEKYGKEAHYGMIDPEILWEYNARDAYYTHILADILWDKMDETQRKLYLELLIPLNNTKMTLEVAGIKIDSIVLAKEEARVTEEVARLRKEFGELVGHPEINPNSSKQVCEVFFDELHVPKFRGRQRTTNKDALAVIRKRLPADSLQAQAIDKLREYRKETKLLSTYLTGFWKYIQFDGRVRTEYLVHGTPTGRFASRDPNLQNIPRNPSIRKMFVAKQGYTLIEADYSQAELRVLAVLSGDQELKRIFLSGYDLHDEMARRFYGEAFTKDERVRAKAINFGIGYGRTPESIAEEYNMPLSEAKKFHADWFKRFPEAAVYLRQIRSDAKSGKPIQNPSGRRRRWPLVLPMMVNAVQNEANNFPMQSTASDLTQMSLIRLVGLWKGSSNRNLILNVHDSLVAEVMDRYVEEAAQEMKRVMEQAAVDLLGDEIPFTVDIKAGPNWGEMKVVTV